MNALRSIPAGILAGASAVLAGASKLAEIGARRLAPPASPERTEILVDEPVVSRTATPPAPEPPVYAAGESIGSALDADLGTDAAERAEDIDDDGRARTYESHIAELAEQNVSAVVRGIQDLSTEELGELFDYESAHRKRKTVLQAIERAAAPPREETVSSTPE